MVCHLEASYKLLQILYKKTEGEKKKRQAQLPGPDVYWMHRKHIQMYILQYSTCRPSLVRTTLIWSLAIMSSGLLIFIIIQFYIHVNYLYETYITYVWQLWYEQVNSLWQLQLEVNRSPKTVDHWQQAGTTGEAGTWN